ncbi:MAG: sulfite exporter TauE/SafE family protein [Neisseriaceae bacterium]|nr:sulfite exporter TauE/SafE family protein [Neisseriaceae bacterium]
MNSYFAFYPLVGLFSGFVAGLFGIGGGLIIVPLLIFIFSAQGLPAEHVMHLALGTSMATIAVTSVSSMRSHHAHGSVRWDIVRTLSPGLVIGTFSAGYFASGFNTHLLAMIFTAVVCFAALSMILAFKPKAHRQLPNTLGLFVMGFLIGCVSAMVGAGGGFLSIPLLLFFGVLTQQAIGTSSALGFPIALTGTIGAIYNGYLVPTLPDYSLGFVYLPALFFVVSMTVFTAPLGAKLAHRLPADTLKRAFGFFLIGLAVRMLTQLTAQ